MAVGKALERRTFQTHCEFAYNRIDRSSVVALVLEVAKHHRSRAIQKTAVEQSVEALAHLLRRILRSAFDEYYTPCGGRHKPHARKPVKPLKVSAHGPSVNTTLRHRAAKRLDIYRRKLLAGKRREKPVAGGGRKAVRIGEHWSGQRMPHAFRQHRIEKNRNVAEADNRHIRPFAERVPVEKRHDIRRALASTRKDEKVYFRVQPELLQQSRALGRRDDLRTRNVRRDLHPITGTHKKISA